MASDAALIFNPLRAARHRRDVNASDTANINSTTAEYSTVGVADVTSPPRHHDVITTSRPMADAQTTEATQTTTAPVNVTMVNVVFLLHYYLRRRRLCFWFGLFVCLFVCLYVG